VTPIFCRSEKVDSVALAPSRVPPTFSLEPTSDGLFFAQRVFFLGYPRLFDRDTETSFLSDLPFAKAGILSAIDSRDRGPSSSSSMGKTIKAFQVDLLSFTIGRVKGGELRVWFLPTKTK
jgi:hypothetical protein